MGITVLCTKTDYSVFIDILVNGVSVADCKISVTSDDGWTISVWCVREDMRHRGLGSKALASAITNMFKFYRPPRYINYIWNGENQYVYDFITRKFDAKPIVSKYVLKNNSDDDKESHIYRLNVNKVREYAQDVNTHSKIPKMVPTDDLINRFKELADHGGLLTNVSQEDLYTQILGVISTAANECDDTLYV